MGFLQIQFINVLAINVLVIIASSKSSLSATPPIAKPSCDDRCGNLSIPYPFGMTPGCYQSDSFFVTCNKSFNPPKTFIQDGLIEIVDISLDGQLRVLNFLGHDCYNKNGTRVSYLDPWITLPISFTVNNTLNKFTMIGCDSYGYVAGRQHSQDLLAGCSAMCHAKDDLIEGSCAGLGCCQTSIPQQVRSVTLGSYGNFSEVWGFNNCSYAFVVEERAFIFSPEILTNLRNVEKLPMVLDWAIGTDRTCEKAKMSDASRYACKSANSKCYEPDTEFGYRCSCLGGYKGNPYLFDGCQDVNECENPHLNNCEKRCVNTIGSFHCACPKGYHGDGRKDGRGCIRSELLAFKHVAGQDNFSFPLP